MRVLLLSLVFTLGGCSTLMNTSFYDSNESKAVVDMWVSVQNLDCASEQSSQQVNGIVDSKNWLKTYSLGKGSKDVQEMIVIFEKSLDPMVGKDMSEGYCNAKKKTLLNQSEKMTRAMMRRF